MKFENISKLLFSLVLIITGGNVFTTHALETEAKPVKKVLFIGDSMTGWMAERLNAYGVANDFEVATIIWDGSTIEKWANAPRLKQIIESQNPDAVFLSLGMNELFEPAPAGKLSNPVAKIKEAIGDRPMLWIGPPNWPGYDKGEVLNKWLQNELGEKKFFRSFDLTLPRQSAKNPHPTKDGIIKWMDAVIEWIPEHTDINLDTSVAPGKTEMSRGKTFIYKRMKETL